MISFKKVLLSAATLLIVLSLTSCDDSTNSPDSGSTQPTLIGVEYDSDTKTYNLVELTFRNNSGTPSYLFSNGSRHPYIYKNAVSDGNYLYFYGYAGEDGQKVRVYDYSSASLDTVPRAATDKDETYSVFNGYFSAANGYCWYIMYEVSAMYSDYPGSYICRYHPESGEFFMRSNPADFTKAQPEKGSDTETGSWGSVFASPDGKSCVGQIMAWGVDGGAIHTDFHFPFYLSDDDFYRIGDYPMKVSGSTSDNSIIYHYRDVMTSADGYHEEFQDFSINSGPKGYANSNGTLKMSNYYGTNIYIIYQDLVNKTQVTCVTTSRSDEIMWTQMAEDGNSILFGIEGDESNYLCKTSDLSEDTTWDTLGTYPSNIVECILK